MTNALVKCALCAEPIDSPGDEYRFVVAVAPVSGKATSIFRTNAVCHACAHPLNNGQLVTVVRRLAGIGERQ